MSSGVCLVGPEKRFLIFSQWLLLTFSTTSLKLSFFSLVSNSQGAELSLILNALKLEWRSNSLIFWVLAYACSYDFDGRMWSKHSKLPVLFLLISTSFAQHLLVCNSSTKSSCFDNPMKTVFFFIIIFIKGLIGRWGVSNALLLVGLHFLGCGLLNIPTRKLSEVLTKIFLSNNREPFSQKEEAKKYWWTLKTGGCHLFVSFLL